MHRLFVAIRPPEDIRDLLIDAMDDSPALRWVGDDQLHLTLRFIGEVERPIANDVAGALSRLRSPQFDLRVNGVGKFEQRNGGALWAAVEPKQPVTALAAKVERAVQLAGLEPERRAFTPDSSARPGTGSDGTIAATWTTGSYFEVLGIPLERGRYFTDADGRERRGEYERNG